MNDWAWFCLLLLVAWVSSVGAHCFGRWLDHKENMAGVAPEDEENA